MATSIFYIFICICCIFQHTFAKISLTKTVVRVPRPKDIGLIFDVTVYNTMDEKKEQYVYQIRADGGCVTNVTRNKNELMKDAGQVYGADFGSIEPGEYQTVSLIWPTLSLYNRVGYCPFVVITEDSKKLKYRFKQKVHFDTRFEILDPESNGLRKLPNYKDCMNWDKDYLKDCRPVRCDEKYFGKRSYFNKKTERCEKVTICDKPHTLYDRFANECLDQKSRITEDDIQMLKDGKYNSEPLELEPNYLWNYESDDSSDNVQEKKARDAKVNLKRTISPGQAQVKTDHIFDEIDHNDDSSRGWLMGVANGSLIVAVIMFLQVFATLAIYVVICFVIYLICSILMRNQTNTNANEEYTVCFGGNPSESSYASARVLSQR